MRLEQLSVNLKALFEYLPIDLNHPLFRSVTHLNMFRIEGIAEVLVELQTLPALTHLALDSDLSRDIALSVLPDWLLLVPWQLFDKRDYMAAQGQMRGPVEMSLSSESEGASLKVRCSLSLLA
jgi:hypothetical protein